MTKTTASTQKECVPKISEFWIITIQMLTFRILKIGMDTYPWHTSPRGLDWTPASTPPLWVWMTTCLCNTNVLSSYSLETLKMTAEIWTISTWCQHPKVVSHQYIPFRSVLKKTFYHTRILNSLCSHDERRYLYFSTMIAKTDDKVLNKIMAYE
jgi:hypothetical protein